MEAMLETMFKHTTLGNLCFPGPGVGFEGRRARFPNMTDLGKPVSA